MDKIPSWLLKLISGAVAVLLLILIVEQLVNISHKAQVIDDKHIVTISAQGKITAKPDLLEISAGVIANGATAVEAQRQNTEKMNQVIAYLKSQGIDPKDIQTTNYSDQPNYDYRVTPPVINGYVANQMVVAKVHNLDSAGALLDGLTKNGANQINSANYTFADPDAIREQARELALSNAKDKAQKLAQAAGVKLGALVTFTEDQNPNPYPIPYAMDAAVGKGSGPVAAPTQIEPGSQDVTATVTVTYSLK